MKKKRILIGVIAAAVVLSGVLGWVAYRYFAPFDPAPYKTEDPEPEPPAQQEPALPANPIDFAALQAENPDVCGWITVPNTNVDHPILQSSKDDDDYYLRRSMDGSWNPNGCIYIQRLNNNQFMDRNTVIYGHNMRNTQMFSTLHYFRDPDFFAENQYFTVYLPHHILTYRIFSAYQYDDRHILNSFDFSDTAVYEDYLKYATNPSSMIKNVREGVTVTTDDRIVTLSTCMNDKTYRYLIQGVLIDDQYTA